MNSIYAVADVSRISRAAIITFASAFALITMTGCFGSPRANDTFAGAAIGAGGGALIGGLGGGAIGYIVGTETENNNRYYGRGYGYYPGGY
jgi:uncharacterized membrane protein